MLVTASSEAAANAGMAILRQGGTAVDGAVATALASCVADPCNTGIGGYGGFMVISFADGRQACVRFAFWAPSTIPAEGLKRSYPSSGPECSAVPNVVAGLARALADFGTLSWDTVSRPAIDLARHGVTANPTTLAAFEEYAGSAFIPQCFKFDDVDAGKGRALIFRQPRLAATLEQMAEQGPAWFYTGPLGPAACEAWRHVCVEVPLDDWVRGPESVEVVPPAHFDVGGMRVCSAPLGFSGSASLFAILEAARRSARQGSLETPEALNDLVAAMASIWQYRLSTPAGNTFTDVTIDQWVSRALSHHATTTPLARGPGHTAHLNVLDKAGTLVALTFTLGPRWFGGGWALADSGVVMNAGMENFARAKPFRHNGRLFGVSNMAPSIARLRDGSRLAVGCPGARRIPANIALVLARHGLLGVGLQSAVSGGRVHAEDLQEVFYEKARLHPQSHQALAQRFAQVTEEGWRRYYGPLTALLARGDGSVEFGLDDRGAPGYARQA